MENFKGSLKKGMENVGLTEYIFGILAFISIIPVIFLYIILIMLIFKPLIRLKNYIKKKIWK